MSEEVIDLDKYRGYKLIFWCLGMSDGDPLGAELSKVMHKIDASTFVYKSQEEGDILAKLNEIRPMIEKAVIPAVLHKYASPVNDEMIYEVHMKGQAVTEWVWKDKCTSYRRIDWIKFKEPEASLPEVEPEPE